MSGLSSVTTITTKFIAITAIGAGAVAIVACGAILDVDNKYIVDGGDSTDAGVDAGDDKDIAGNSTGGADSGPDAVGGGDAGAPLDTCALSPPRNTKRLTLTARFQQRPSDKTTVTVSLMQYLTPVAIATGTLNSSDIVCLDFGPVSNLSSFYIVVKTPHSLETWSATWQSFVNGALSYDFTTGVDKAYGANMHWNAATGKAEIIEGDVNQDGFIEVGDMTTIFHDKKCRCSGFVTDVNADGVVDDLDVNIAQSNVAIGAEVLRPY
jgi:hypothetical protein